jgi:hypothetical protein
VRRAGRKKTRRRKAVGRMLARKIRRGRGKLAAAIDAGMEPMP